MVLNYHDLTEIECSSCSVDFFQLFHLQGGYFLRFYAFSYRDFVHEEVFSLVQGAGGILPSKFRQICLKFHQTSKIPWNIKKIHGTTGTP